MTTDECQRSVEYPSAVVSEQSLRDAATLLEITAVALRDARASSLQSVTTALHEIRKLNGKLKIGSERLWRDNAFGVADQARLSAMHIWRMAEMMSQQFDVIEVLATEQLATLPLNATIDLRSNVENCVLIYNDQLLRINLVAHRSMAPCLIRACDRTLSIIPMVLIENALRHSVSGSEVTVEVESRTGTILLSVTNDAIGDEPIDRRVFERGVRLSRARDGNGDGLYVAQLVAQQHKTRIHVSSSRVSESVVRCCFQVSFASA